MQIWGLKHNNQNICTFKKQDYLAFNQGTSRLDQVINNDHMTAGRITLFKPDYSLIILPDFSANYLGEEIY